MPPDPVVRLVEAEGRRAGAAPSTSQAAPLVRLAESAEVSVLAVDADGIITYCGAEARRLFRADGDLVGKPLVLLFEPPFRELIAQAIGEAVSERRPPPVQCRHRRGGDSEFDLSLELLPAVAPDRERPQVAVAVHDVTEQRWMSSTLDVTLQALRQALEEARSSEERMQRFLADAAHQLRTPMAGIRVAAEMLLLGPDERHRDDLMTLLIRETERATDLMASLLAMARTEQGVESERQPADLVVLCELEAERARSLAPNLSVVVEAPDGLPLVVLDPRGLREMLANLLDNARRHARSKVAIEVDGAIASDVVSIAVSDDGPGVAPQQSDRIFDRFVSLDGEGGSGLGLSIARAVARAHGGDLGYDGGRFVATLPATFSP